MFFSSSAAAHNSPGYVCMPPFNWTAGLMVRVPLPCLPSRERSIPHCGLEASLSEVISTTEVV